VPRRLILLAALGVVLSSCAQGPVATSGQELGVFSASELSSRLAESDRPTVVNIWASWCVPCRSEAPLFVAAHERFGDRIDFVGIAIQDTDKDARAFLAEFGITYENLADPEGAVRGVIPGTGVPLTYFVAPGGELISSHFGVIDEGALALALDELLLRS